MSIQILGDSCCDLTPALKTLLGVRLIPLELRPNQELSFVDDETLDTDALLRAMKASKQATSTACPSPEAYAGGPIAAVRDGDIIDIDIPARSLNVRLSDEEIAARLKDFKPVERPVVGVQKKYRKLVSSGATGAYLNRD